MGPGAYTSHDPDIYIYIMLACKMTKVICTMQQHHPLEKVFMERIGKNMKQFESTSGHCHEQLWHQPPSRKGATVSPAVSQ